MNKPDDVIQGQNGNTHTKKVLTTATHARTPPNLSVHTPALHALIVCACYLAEGVCAGQCDGLHEDLEADGTQTVFFGQRSLLAPPPYVRALNL